MRDRDELFSFEIERLSTNQKNELDQRETLQLSVEAWALKSGNPATRSSGKNLNTACNLHLTFKYGVDTIVPKMNE